jgi:hypothetical protein
MTWACTAWSLAPSAPLRWTIRTLNPGRGRGVAARPQREWGWPGGEDGALRPPTRGDCGGGLAVGGVGGCSLVVRGPARRAGGLGEVAVWSVWTVLGPHARWPAAVPGVRGCGCGFISLAAIGGATALGRSTLRWRSVMGPNELCSCRCNDSSGLCSSSSEQRTRRRSPVSFALLLHGLAFDRPQAT